MRRWALIAIGGVTISCGSATIQSASQGPDTGGGRGGGADAGAGGHAGAGGAGGACTTTCVAGTQECESSTTIATCQQGSSGCTEWATSRTCPSGAACESAACTVRYGFSSTFSSAVMANTGYFFGETISVPTPITATKLGAIFSNAASANATLALYTDVSNSPSALVAQTASTTIKNGTNEIAMPSTHLEAGTYWLMAEYTVAVDVEVSNCDNCQVVATVTSSYVAFPSKLTATTGTGSNLAYYVVGTE